MLLMAMAMVLVIDIIKNFIRKFQAFSRKHDKPLVCHPELVSGSISHNQSDFNKAEKLSNDTFLIKTNLTLPTHW